MSVKPNRGIALLLPLLVGACGVGSESEDTPLGACSSALNAAQGTRMQAVSLQGISPRGAGFEALAVAGASLGSAAFARLELRGGELVASLGPASVLRGAELQGLSLPFVTRTSETLWVEIARAEHAGAGDDEWLYALELEGQSLCEGDGLGVFVPGVWDEAGRHLASLEAGGRSLDATFSCRAGVIAKCVSWGYAPSLVGAELHQACTRMARADYCGDGVAHTEDGTLIDLFDERGVQSPVDADNLSFEAGWGPEGALCVGQPRYVVMSSDGAIELPACWNDKPRCDTWEKARELGAVLGNDSAHTVRAASCQTL